MLEEFITSAPKDCPWPKALRLPLDAPRAVSVIEQPSFVKTRWTSRARRAGLEYEGRVKGHIRELLPKVSLSTWFQYYEGMMKRVCQTDAVLFSSSRLLTIFEVKAQHTSDAWWQLHELYRPVLRAYRPEAHINLVEVCRSFDPAAAFPTQVTLVSDLVEWCSAPREEFGVFRWKP